MGPLGPQQACAHPLIILYKHHTPPPVQIIASSLEAGPGVRFVANEALSGKQRCEGRAVKGADQRVAGQRVDSAWAPSDAGTPNTLRPRP